MNNEDLRWIDLCKLLNEKIQHYKSERYMIQEIHSKFTTD